MSERSEGSSASSSSASSTSEGSSARSSKTTTQASQIGNVSTRSSKEARTQADGPSGRSAAMAPTQADKTATKKDAGKARPTGRKLTIIRHAERMDRVMPYWILESFDESDKYRPYDLNQPLKLPDRPGGRLAYQIDPPLTEIGRMTSQMLGRGMKKNGFPVTYVYASPSWRCVETANELVKGFAGPIQIRIEPGLFEWMQWYKDSEPEWVSPEAFAAMGYSIDTNYRPFIQPAVVLREKTESIDQHYDRVMNVVHQISEQCSGPTDSVLIVGHGLTVDGGNRHLRGLPPDPPKPNEIIRMGLYYPYLCVVQVEEMTNQMWRIVDNPIQPITHLDVSNRIEAKFYNR